MRHLFKGFSLTSLRKGKKAPQAIHYYNSTLFDTWKDFKILFLKMNLKKKINAYKERPFCRRI